MGDDNTQIPENLNYEKAATIPAALITPFVGLYWKLKLTPLSVPEGLGKYNGVPFVILGGSSAIGQFGWSSFSILEFDLKAEQLSNWPSYLDSPP